jgi:polyphosphate kinase 2
LSDAKYKRQLEKYQGQLNLLYRDAKARGRSAILVFEGWDAAGKGGIIRRITGAMDARDYQVIPIAAPTAEEHAFHYLWRFWRHLPRAGRVTIFDRSWYNRAGVEYVMGFCTKEQRQRFLELCPVFEKYIVDGGIMLIKYWLEVSNEEQERRFEARIQDPLRQWKLSPMDLPARKRWYDYSRARDIMFKKTDTRIAPWYIVPSDDKRTARLNTIAHLLSAIPHKKLPHQKVKLPQRSSKDAYDDEASIARRRFVAQRY